MLDTSPDSPASAEHLHQILPGVPHIESPFFAQFFSAPEIDAETRRIAHEMHTKGYAVIDFPEEDFAAMAERIQQNLLPHYDFERWKNIGHAAGNSLRLPDAWKFDADVKRIACNSHILELLSKLYGAQAWPFQTLNFPVGTQQHFHSDSVHFSSVPERFMCGVWVALEDVDENNGPLQYSPGSHQWPIYVNEHIGRCVSEMTGKVTQVLYEEMWRALVEAKQAKFEPFYAKKGQALIWAANLMHGGCKQLDRERTRWSQVTHYFFENCAYYTPMLSDPVYGHTNFRRLSNIATGEIMPQRYAGYPISEEATLNQAMKHFLKFGFNAELYLAANPDVKAAGMNPYEHFAKFGNKENRRMRP